jgi:hypothetical protein
MIRQPNTPLVNMNRRTVIGGRNKTSEMAVKKTSVGRRDPGQAAAARDFTTRQYGKVLVKITIMTNSWHNKYYQGSYVENVTSEQCLFSGLVFNICTGYSYLRALE